MNRIAIELEGAFGGWLLSTEGGDAVGEVIVEKPGPKGVQLKHIAGVKYEDITIVCGIGMHKHLVDWIKDTLDRKPSRKNGAIIVADLEYREVFRLSFFDSLISEIRFPTLDVLSKHTATISLTIKPKHTRLQFGTGAKVFVGVSTRQKKCLSSNFKIEIDGLPNSTSRVVEVETLVFKQKTVESSESEPRFQEKERSALEVPNLVITLAESHAAELYQWHENFVIKGNPHQEQEKNGSLAFLAPNMKETLLTVKFSRLGIYKLRLDKVEATGENVRRVKAEMYYEEMKLEYKL